MTTLLQLIIFPNNPKTLVYSKDLHNLYIYQFKSKRYFKIIKFHYACGKGAGEVRMS